MIAVSIIISNRNGAQFLKNCLDSILREKSTQYEIIVVDDASSDASPQILQAYKSQKNIRVIYLPSHAGIAVARNMGAQKAVGKYLFFLDADTIIMPGWLNHITDFFLHHKKTALAQAKLLRKGSNHFDSAGEYISPFGFLVERSGKGKDTGQFKSPDCIFSARGAAFIIRSSVFRMLCGFDKDYSFYLEDTDLSWRVWLAGYHVRFIPAVVVYHAYGTKEKGNEHYKDRQVYYTGCRNFLITIAKNIGFPRILYVLPVQYASWTVLSIVFILSGRRIDGISIFKGVFASIGEIGSTYHKRRDIQRRRVIDDSTLFNAVGRVQGISYYFAKARSYIQGKPY